MKQITVKKLIEELERVTSDGNKEKLVAFTTQSQGDFALLEVVCEHPNEVRIELD